MGREAEIDTDEVVGKGQEAQKILFGILADHQYPREHAFGKLYSDMLDFIVADGLIDDFITYLFPAAVRPAIADKMNR